MVPAHENCAKPTDKMAIETTCARIPRVFLNVMFCNSPSFLNVCDRSPEYTGFGRYFREWFNTSGRLHCKPAATPHRQGMASGLQVPARLRTRSLPRH